MNKFITKYVFFCLSSILYVDYDKIIFVDLVCYFYCKDINTVYFCKIINKNN